MEMVVQTFAQSSQALNVETGTKTKQTPVLSTVEMGQPKRSLSHFSLASSHLGIQFLPQALLIKEETTELTLAMTAIL
jgi:hypothetical protein